MNAHLMPLVSLSLYCNLNAQMDQTFVMEASQALGRHSSRPRTFLFIGLHLSPGQEGVNSFA